MKIRVPFSILALAFSLGIMAQAHAVDYVWIEGETPTSINIPQKDSGVEHPEFLSEGKWLQVTMDAAAQKTSLPAEGILISYSFKIATQQEYEIWNRIGFEFARSPFDWRVDGGEWKTVKPDELTTDLTALGFFCEVAWYKLGQQALAPGEHKLEIRLAQVLDAKGAPQRILYALDALCIYPGKFIPNGKFKPDQAWQEQKDLDAAKTQFTVPEAAGAAQTSISLKGLWQITRDDEQEPRDVGTPIAALPANPIWKGIEVPGDKNTLRPELLFAHRLWYRTQVNVPASQKDRSFYLVFPENNLNTTVYVNGKFCGFDKNPWARIQIDISGAIKPGVNEVYVGIRDAWYARSESPTDTRRLRGSWNLPLKKFTEGFQDFAYPVWAGPQSGILDEPSLVVAGPVYTSDVFAKPSVAKKELDAEVTLTNPSSKEFTGEIAWSAVNVKTGEVEKTFTPKPFSIGAGKTATLQLADRWEAPKLWWPDDPNLYYLRTTLNVGGKAVDITDTRFGFREWTLDGIFFRLNGVKWPMWATLDDGSSKESMLKWYKDTNQRTYRLMGMAQGGFRTHGMQPNQALDYFDENGFNVRRCGPLDGEALGYFAIQNNPELVKRDNSKLNMPLLNNSRDQMIAQVKGERNHPSIQIWSIENEFLYINCINLYAGMMDEFEAEFKKMSDAVMAVDPTRSTMTDGGGANKDQSMPVHGNHYVGFNSAAEFMKYPQLAYERNPDGGGRGRWIWDQKRPRFIGEDFFATGINPADYSAIGGEETFLGKTYARPAAGLITNMLTQGYRWVDIAGVHHWLHNGDADKYWLSFSPVAVFCKQWDSTFDGGSTVKRTMKVFNNSHYNDPISLTWSLDIAGKKVAGETKEFNVPAGEAQEFEVALPLPKVTARAEGTWTLSLTQRGATVYNDTKAVSVLNGDATLSTPKLNPYVYDPQGAVSAYFTAHKIPFTPLRDLESLPTRPSVLIIGKDALSAAESTSTRLAAFASTGSRVIVMEQKFPLKYQALPAEMDVAENYGSFAFAEDLNHPVLRGLQQKDFFVWNGDGLLYRNAYKKAERGAKSLVQCDVKLGNTALIEVPTGDGVILLSQLIIGEKLGTNAVAKKLLLNLIDYAASYKIEFRQVVAATGDNKPLSNVLQSIGLKFTVADSPLAALASKEAKIAIIDASPANLKALAGDLATVSTFTQNGGWILFNNLTPDGIEDYNKIVGFDHMIRPFRRERVSLAVPRNPLATGFTLGDVVMLSSERIFAWTADMFVSNDEFSYVVDYEDVAPFAKFSNDFALNTVNGFVNADGWKYIYNVPAPEVPPLDLPLVFSKEQEIRGLEWIGNTNYWPVTKVQLVVDGKESAVFDTDGNNEPHTFPIEPALKGTDVKLRMADWKKVEGKNAVTGLDNIRLFAKRSPEFYEKVKPLLNIGGMMEYPQGKGGILLCNLLFKDSEVVPANFGKKRALFSTLLRNLKAPFGGAKTIIAGANLKYTPIDISKQANQFRNEQGWYGDKNSTFKDLPLGKQKFAGVSYDVYEFPTSPVPTTIMLGANGIPGNLADHVNDIPVNLKADALFFLQAARIDKRRTPDEIKKGVKFELARYVVHYVDGKTENIPVYSEINVENYKQKAPALPISGAQLAWSSPFAGSDQATAAYSMQWNNPHPDVVIKSIDLVYGAQKGGVPSLIAISAATAQ